MRTGIVLACIAASLPGIPAWADDSRIWVADTGAGQEVRVHDYVSLNPHCESLGVPQITITEPPAHGTVDIRQQEFRIASTEGGDRGCVGQSVQGVSVIYTPQADYRGTDRFDLSVRDPDGSTAQDTMLVTVK